MGCISSKTDINDLHPNVFHVMNVNEEGQFLSSGQLEITEADIIFYQKGKVPMKWPLKCLRRYGFDAELFSFESGRRCPTGPGIYAFNCRRAEQLFNMLQCHIQHCHNGAGGEDAVSREFPTVGMSSAPSISSSSMLMSTSISRTGFPGNGMANGVNDNLGAGLDNGNYLEPVRSTARGPPTAPRVMPMQVGNGLNSIARLSVSSGPLSPQSTTSPPPNVNICLGTVVGSTSSAVDNSTSLYANEELFTDPDGRVPVLEDTSRSAFPAYTNGSAVATPSESSKPTQRLELTEAQPEPLSVSGGSSKTPGSVAPAPLPLPYMNLGLGSPHSPYDTETNYAKLDDLIKSEQEAQLHLYMNVVPENAKDPTAKAISLSEQHCYENLEPGEISSEINGKVVLTALSPVDAVAATPSSRVGTAVGPTPVSQVPIHLSLAPVAPTIPEAAPVREVNYVVLDLDRGSDSNNSQTLPTSPLGSVASFPESPRRVSEGYATIDFNKTVALSHSVNPNMDNDTEGSRKTRHNSTINDLSLTRNSSSLSD
ncbi:fibroblast growth factor receptor substrate 2 [Ischnura elegans]|uniref:fibroblast growth factor receptor substrate 2 n=1 Tax=Ischnura elegans TaxID=197161 RepID=UPI001ED86930|nr:fibroblast growth factor receptor substrate 2 [Ischnura elegans]XP_046388504.1 fibroblast growth factor receptor substrate 2 [Ischnura elegans]